ncbi:MAG: Deoxyuridine 5'-triphosphate nucleotidohydrolase [Candidatus Methanoperedenaceae archaeon GB50]|nr:MAG: Deoxyuridine 5'-triphosphate nucleotidohydrolase [Candidatus Methanoperedenaceae archaeon GB50]
MSVLSRSELLEMVEGSPRLVEGICDLGVQVQPNGVELTLQRIERFIGYGAVAYENSERVIAPSEPIGFGSDGWVYLEPGVYKVIFNEVVNVPLGMAAIARPRSSLTRCGVTVETGVWDAGYSGRSESMLVVYNRYGFRVKRNARLVQLVFFHLTKPVDVGYDGVYQGENR